MDTGAPVIVPVEGSLIVSAAGGGFLLDRIGECVNVDTRAACLDAFRALAALHAAGVTHGDARLPNLLRVDDGLRWIDLLGGAVAASECASGAFLGLSLNDAELFARSALSAAAPTELTDNVRAALEAHRADVPETVAVLAAAVWEAKPLKAAVQRR